MRPPLPRPLRAASALLLAVGTACTPAEPSDTGAEAPFFPPQNRPDVRGTHGAVVSDHPLASAAGYRVLLEGGNAVDAAIAMAGVLSVVRPHMNGVGGDAFVFVYEAGTGALHTLNGSGRAGALATPGFFGEADAIPETGPLTVSVPGAVRAWTDLHDRFGTRPLGQLLAPAVGYARDGFPVSTRLAADFEAQGAALDETGRALFLPDGAPPPVGALLRNPALATTLERIGREGADGFYRGPVARALADFLEERGGYLRAPDFAGHTSTWVEPLTVEYLDHTVHAFPPNTQGPAQIQMMEMAKSFAMNEMGHNTSSYLHHLVEAKKLAFADRDRWVADPDVADVPTERLLDPAYLAARAALVDPEHAAWPVPSGIGADGPEGVDPATMDDGGDTVYLTVVDRDGNAVSWIQSLYAGFGSGLVEPTTGVVLQNRGALFTLEEGHPNRIAPGKRPFHTLSPLIVLRDGALAFTLGTPGGDSQPQSLLQITNNMLLFGMPPQEAIEAPRFRSQAGLRLALEDRIPPEVRDELAALGHDIRVVPGWTATFGGAQMIRVDPVGGGLTAAADPRREAYAIAY
ncbi:MAG TPA: gamma-glutamyltransferase [Longimicrobiales bacterium]|nr:gamma-glutamyltransferase [Longimicrobiales bacterium]